MAGTTYACHHGHHLSIQLLLQIWRLWSARGEGPHSYFAVRDAVRAAYSPGTATDKAVPSYVEKAVSEGFLVALDKNQGRLDFIAHNTAPQYTYLVRLEAFRDCLPRSVTRLSGTAPRSPRARPHEDARL